MKITHGGELDVFLKLADETTAEVLASDGPLVPALRAYHLFFVDELLATAGIEKTPSVALLAMNGHFYWLAAVRVALSGQMTGVFPLLRTGLEAFCYSALIKRDPELEPAWRDRDDNDAARSACRRAFTGAVKDIAKQIESETEGGGTWILEHYEAAIEWGGHPNPKVVFQHTTMQDLDDEIHVQVIALHGAGSPAARAAMVACLDLGLAMASVAVWAFGLEESLGHRLHEMEALKESAAAWRPEDEAA